MVGHGHCLVRGLCLFAPRYLLVQVYCSIAVCSSILMSSILNYKKPWALIILSPN